MISVIIPLYNKEKQVAHTLESVLSQTFQRFEIVVVNDGSTDNSVAEVEKIGDSRIRLIHQKNGGVSAARNRGIEDSKYELLAFWMPMMNGNRSIWKHNIICLRNIPCVVYMLVTMSLEMLKAEYLQQLSENFHLWNKKVY